MQRRGETSPLSTFLTRSYRRVSKMRKTWLSSSFVFLIKLRGVLVDILVGIAPEVYKAYAYKDKKGVPQLLVQCQNALYGTMVASLLYYRKFVKSLTDIGFEINPYDPCVANKMIDRKQMTICWHVDDLKASHVKSKIMDRMVKYHRQECESMFEDGSG